jgi:hypothetical protein
MEKKRKNGETGFFWNRLDLQSSGDFEKSVLGFLWRVHGERAEGKGLKF